MFSAVDAGKVSKAAPSASEASRLVLSGHHLKGRFSVVVVPLPSQESAHKYVGKGSSALTCWWTRPKKTVR